jgi:hypothetical protein
MKKVQYISLAIVFILSCYLLSTAVFVRLFSAASSMSLTTRTPVPTFTPTATGAAAVVFTSTPSPVPTKPPATPTPTATPMATPTPLPTPTPVPQPELVATSAVNIRSGPGTAYPVVGALRANDRATITGRNADSSWWQIEAGDGTTGWVAAWVVQATQTDGVPVTAAPPPPPPTPTSPPPLPEQPRYQYEPTGWFDDTNYGLTRFLGTITDVNGNPVNGVYVEASCGAFRVLSNASGTTGWPPGFYDIVLARRPVPCDWGLAVVSSDDGKTATGQLSELITITITVDKSIVTANWRKNW